MPVVRPSLRVIAATLLPLLLATCTEDTLGPIGRPGSAALAIESRAPNVSEFAGLTITQVRAIVTELPPTGARSDSLLDKKFPFPASSNSLSLDLTVPLRQAIDTVNVELEYLSGVLVIFSGSQQVEVRQGPPGTTQPVPIAVAYVGPGSNIASIAMAPNDTTVTAGGTFPFRVTAIDSSDGDVPSFYLSWKSGSPTNPVTADGVFHAGTARATVTVIAATPNGSADTTKVFVLPAPTAVVKVSGDGQSGPVSLRLAQPIVVEVRGADNLPISGVTVAFNVATGGGTVDSTTVTTGGNGQAGTTVLLGATVGAQTFTATVTGAPVATFSETGTAVGPTTLTWTGAVSTDWFTAGNWSPAAVPGATDNVVIANTATKPTVGTATTINNLTVNTGGTLTIGSVAMTVSGFAAVSGTVTGAGSLTVAGPITTLIGSTLNPSVLFVGNNLVVAGTYAVASTNFTGTGQAMPPLAYQNVAISGTVSLTSRTTVATGVNIIANGHLTLGGHTLVTGLLQVGQTAGDAALLVMSNAIDSVLAGNATFQGGDETGSLTAGVIQVSGNFSQTALNSPMAFAASGTHRVVLTGATAQSITLATPAGAQSHFNDLDLSTAVGFVMTGNIQINGQLISLPATGTPSVTGAIGQVLTARGVNVSRLSVTASPMIIGAGTITRFDSVAFSGQAATAIALSVNDPGTSAHYSFNGLRFVTTPTSGAYLRAFDTDGIAPVLTVDMVNPTPATPGAFTVITGGAVINWPAAAPTLTWNGGVDNSWQTAANWTPNQVPTATSDVTIPSGTLNAPTLFAAATTRNLTVATGVNIDLVANTLTVNGNLANSGNFHGAGQIVMAGTGSFGGSYQNLVVSGANTLSGTTVLSGNLTITGVGAALDLSGFDGAVTGNLSVQGAGKLISTAPSSSLTVSGSAVFDGASEAGFLTAGTLTVLGNFTQSATSSGESFSASGSHLTVLSNSNPTVGFATPGSLTNQSRFADLTWSGGGTLTQNSGITITRTLTTVSTSASTFHGTIAGGRFLQFATTVAGGPLVFDNIRVIVNQTTQVGAFSLDNATFQGLASTATQLTVQHPGLATPIVMNNLTFSVPPTGTGLYLLATDNTADANILTLNLTGVTPASPGAFTSVTGGAVINWPVSAAKTWLGTTTAWNTASNWSPAGVPSATDDVTIPATANNPIEAGGNVRDLTVASGATLTAGGGVFLVGGNVDATGPIVVDTALAAFELTGTGKTVKGSIQYPVILGTYTATGPIVISHNLQIQGAGGNLDIAGQTVTVGHDLLLQSTGTITMTNGAGVLSIGRNARFTGGSTAGKLTAGRIDLTGNLTQDNSGCACAASNSSFSPSGTHLVNLIGTTTQSIDIFNTGLGATLSHFNNLQVTGKVGSVDFTRLGTTFVAGQLMSTPVATPAILTTSNAAKLQVGDANVNGLTLTALPLTISGPTITQFNKATFQGYAATDQQLTVIGPGATTPFIFNQLTFSTTPTGAGRYIVASDTLADVNALTLNLITPTPATAGGFTTVNGGAVINWPAAAPAITWVGTTSNWFTPGNWSGGAVPTSTDDVIIAAAAAGPALTTSTAVHNLNVTTGSMTLTSATLTVSGNLDVAAGGALIGAGTDTVLMTGTSNAISGSIGARLALANAELAAGPITLTGGNTLVIGNGGVLSLAGHTVTTARLETSVNGRVIMTNATDSLKVSQAAIFGGGTETGLLSAGVVVLGDTLIQTGVNSTASYAGNGSHKSVFNGGAGFISFSDPGASNFQDLDISPVSGTVTLATAAVALGNFTRGSTGTFALDSLVLIIQGNATSAGSITSTTGGIALSGVSRTMQGNFGTALLTIQGATALGGATTTGDLAITNGTLDLAGHRLTAQTVTTAASGSISMTAALDTMVVAGDLLLNGASTLSTLTNGAILLAGNMLQGPTGSPSAFSGSGNFAVVFTGTAAQQVHFANPGPITSHFQNVVIANASAGGVSVDSVYVLGSAAFLPALPRANRVIHGNGAGSRIVLSNLNITQTTFDNLAVSTPSDGSAVITKFDSVTFSNTATSDTALTINHPGTGGPFTFHNLVFDVVPATGAYIRANDTDGATPTALTIDLSAPTPATGGGFVQQVNGAVVNWPAAAPVVTWTGGTGGTDWNSGANWSTGTVPSATDSVVIVASTTTPVLTGPISTGAINVASGTITLNGQTLAVQRTLATTGTGTITMTNAGDVLTVGGNASFAGGSTAGLLTAGTVQLAGSLTQAGNPQSFTPSGTGTLLLSLFGSTAHTVTFSTSAPTPAQPDLRNVVISGSGAVDFNDGARIHGALTVNSPVVVSCGVAPTICQVDSALTTVTGSAINMGALGLGGTVFNVAGSYTVATTEFVGGPGQLIPASVPYQDMRIFTSAVTAAPLSITGELRLATALGTPSLTLGGSFAAGTDILINGGNLTVNGHSLTTPGTLTVQGTGTVTMTNAADVLTVGGDASFDGGSETAKLTAGSLAVGGNFTVGQTNSTTAFQASGTHSTSLFGATGTRTIAVVNPGPTANHFGDLVFTGAVSVTLSGAPVFVQGTLTSTTTGAVVHGNGFTIDAAATDVQGLIFDNTPLQIQSTTSPASLVLDNATFQNMSTATDQLEIILPGVATPYVLTNLVFSTTPVTGFYIFANDNNPSNGLVLTVNLASPNPSLPGAFTSVGGGAVINWPAAAPTISWTGATSTNWSTATNWSGGVVPSPTDSVVIPAVTNSPALTAATSVGAVNVTGGTLTIGAQTLTVARSFTTTGTGTLSMTNAAGQLLIGGNASFAGGATNTSLTAGTIDVAGNFTQAGNALSFAPSVTGTLLTRFSGATLQTVAFTTSDPSPTQGDLRNVAVTGAGGITNSTGMWIHGALAVNTTTTVGGALIEVDSTLTTIAGSTYNPTQTLLGGNVFNVAGTYNVSLTSFVGGPSQIIPTTLPLQNVDIPVPINTTGVLNISGKLSITPVQVSTSFTYNTPRLTLGADLNVTGDLSVLAGQLIIGGHVLTADANFITQNDGILRMDTPGDQLNVALNATFQGGDETDALTFGILRVAGDFNQISTNSTGSFRAATGHLTILNGSGTQQVNFADSLQSSFGDLSVSSTGTVIVSSLPLVDGQLTVQAGTLTSSDLTSTGTGLYVKGKVLSGAGTTIHLGRLFVGDSLLPVGTYNVSLTGFVGNNTQPIPVGVAYHDMDLAGAGAGTQGAITVPGRLRLIPGRSSSNSILFLGGRLTVGGDLVLDGNNTELVMNASVAAVTGNFTVQTGALLTMTNSNDSLIVAGNALFDGGDETGHLGNFAHFVLQGNLTQRHSSSVKSLVATNQWFTTLNGTGVQTLDFADSSTSNLGPLTLLGPHANVVGLIGVAGDIDIVSNGGILSSTDQTINGGGFNVFGNLTAPNPSALNLGRLYITGDLQSPIAGYSVAATIFDGTGQLAPSDLPYKSLYTDGTVTFLSGAMNVATQMIVFSGSATLNGNLTVAGPVSVQGGTLVLNGNGFGVQGGFQTAGSGTVTMTNTADSMDVLGPTIFGGASETGLLTAGTLYVRNDFSQLGGQSLQSYLESGTHATRFVGSGQTISFQSPGTNNSAFNDLWFTQATGPVNFTSDVFVKGVVQWGGFKTYTGSGKTLTLASLNIGNGALFDNLLVDVESGGPMSTTGVQFQNYSPTANVFTVNGPGTSATNNLSMQFLSPITSGHYVVANKNGGLAGLTLSMGSGGQPGTNNGPLGTLVIGGAVVNWLN